MATTVESYKRNRIRVYEIYGIPSDDRSYNCHHIVTQEDHSTGVISQSFKIHEKSNLYPLRRCLHQQLNEIIMAVDSDQDIAPLLLRFHQTEKFIQHEEEVLSRKKKDRFNQFRFTFNSNTKH